MPQCECPHYGRQGCPDSAYNAEKELPFVYHNPGECKCTNQLKLWRNEAGKTRWLCSICCFTDGFTIEVVN